MRIINYKYGYYPTFSCSIGGKIVVTKREWAKITKYLFDRRHKIGGNYDILYRPILAEDVLRTIETKDGILLNIRVPATEKVIEVFKSTGRKYRRDNYMFLIKN